MSLKEALERISREHVAAKAQPFNKHPLAQFIRRTAADEVRKALGDTNRDLLIEGSPGAGNWAEVPWIGVFDPLITDSATGGYYPVYLFHVSEPIVHLSLNQGTTETRAQFAGETRNVLRDRASIMRKRLADYMDLLPVTAIDLGSNARLPGDYIAAHILGLTYALNQLPEEANLRADLQTVVSAYRALTFRGGPNPTDEGDESDDAD